MGSIYRRGKTWHATYVDRSGKRVRQSLGVTDRSVAQKLLAKLVSEDSMIHFGVKKESREGEGIGSHLDSFITSMEASGTTDEHCRRTRRLIRQYVTAGSWKALKDVTADSITKSMAQQRKAGLSNRTIHAGLTAMRSFCRHLVRQEVLQQDPTQHIAKPSLETDRRKERRMLLPAEWTWLKKYLAGSNAAIRNGQEAGERLLMYQTAIETGLRANELLTLTASSLHLDCSEPYVEIEAANAKNRTDARQFVSDELAAGLKRLVKSKLPIAVVFKAASRFRTAEVLREDLADARKLWLETPEGQKKAKTDFLEPTNGKGEILDFHSLRHTCGAWLVMQGISLPEVQSIMRHSSITLTIDRYGHLAPDARARCRNVLGKLLG